MTIARTDLPTIRLRRGPEAASVVRGIAKAVFAFGLITIGFVAYQFGVTTYLANREQASLRAELEQRFDDVVVQATAYEPRALPPSPITIPPQVAELPDAVAPAGPSLPSPEFVVSEPLPLQGQALGRIVIPAAGVDWTVVEGVSRDDLRTGAGHVPETALPGQEGNAVISGHRTTYGAPFLHLDRVEVGDEITVETATGIHSYRAVESLVVKPHETWVTEQWSGAWLTLTTCEPVLSASHRLVVVATLVAGPNAGVILDRT